MAFGRGSTDLLMIWVPALVGMVVALISTPFVIAALGRWKVVDIASERSSHTGTALRGVGLATLIGVLAGALAGFALLDGLELSISLVIVLTAVLGALLGVIEDFWGLSVRFRASLQLTLAVLATAALITFSTSSWLLGIPAVIFIAGYINVANFMDGVNGISGLHGLLCGAFYVCLGLLTQTEWLVLVGSLLAACFLSFLPWNLVRKGTFLGDTGSYLLGAFVATTAVAAWISGVNLLVAFAPTIIYCVDTGGTLLRRIVRRETWYEAHRGHVYQKLTTEGFSHVGSSMLVGSCTLLVAAASLLLLQPMIWLSVVALLVMLLISLLYWNSPALVRKINQEAQDTREADAV